MRDHRYIHHLPLAGRKGQKGKLRKRNPRISWYRPKRWPTKSKRERLCNQDVCPDTLERHSIGHCWIVWYSATANSTTNLGSRSGKDQDSEDWEDEYDPWGGDDVHTVVDRAATFHSWKYTSKYYQIAEAGFFSTGDFGEVQCFRCGMDLDWFDFYRKNVWKVHAQKSPMCSFLQESGKDNAGDETECEDPDDDLTKELKGVNRWGEQLRLQQNVQRDLHDILNIDSSEDQQVICEGELFGKLKKEEGHHKILRLKLEDERCKRYTPMVEELRQRSRQIIDKMNSGTSKDLDDPYFMEEQAHVFELENKLLRRLSRAKDSLEKALIDGVRDERKHRQQQLVQRLIGRSEDIRRKLRHQADVPQEFRQAGEKKSEMEEQLLKALTGDEDDDALRQKLLHERNLRRKEYLRCDIRQHERCSREGSPCPLTRALMTLDMAATPDVGNTVGRKILCEAENLVVSIVKRLGEVETIFQEIIPVFETFSVELRGSCTNGLKTGRVDEMDFLVKLEELNFAEKDGWKIIPDSENLNMFLGPRDHDIADLDTSWQLQYQGLEVPKLARNFIPETSWLPWKDKSEYLSGTSLKQTFKEALDAAVEVLIEKQPAVPPSSVSFLYDDRTLSYFPADVTFSVKMDITPCVSVTRLNGTVQWLVPSLGFNNWQKVNVDPRELDDPSVSRAVRLIKTLRDAAEDSDTGYSRNVYCVMDETGDECTSYGEVSHFLTQHFATAVDRPLHSSIPSYAIMGTVAREFRCDSNRPLCFLLLTSLLNFEMIDPEEIPISRNVASEGKAHEVLSRCSDILLYICDAGSDIEEAIQCILPPYYHTHPYCLMNDLGSSTPTSVFSYPQLKLLQSEEAGTEASAQVHVAGMAGTHSGNHWVVHRVGKKRFTSLCQQQISPVKTERRKLLKPLEGNKTSDHLHIAVLTLEDKIFWSYFSDYNTTVKESSMEAVLMRYVVRTGDQLTVRKASV